MAGEGEAGRGGKRSWRGGRSRQRRKGGTVQGEEEQAGMEEGKEGNKEG